METIRGDEGTGHVMCTVKGETASNLQKQHQKNRVVYE